MGRKLKKEDSGPLSLNLDFMKKIVGAPALRLVKELPDGTIKGFVLTKHMNAIVTAYKKDANKFVQGCDIEEFDCGGHTEYSYFEITP